MSAVYAAPLLAETAWRNRCRPPSLRPWSIGAHPTTGAGAKPGQIPRTAVLRSASDGPVAAKPFPSWCAAEHWRRELRGRSRCGSASAAGRPAAFHDLGSGALRPGWVRRSAFECGDGAPRFRIRPRRAEAVVSHCHARQTPPRATRGQVCPAPARYAPIMPRRHHGEHRANARLPAGPGARPSVPTRRCVSDPHQGQVQVAVVREDRAVGEDAERGSQQHQEHERSDPRAGRPAPQHPCAREDHDGREHARDHRRIGQRERRRRLVHDRESRGPHQLARETLRAKRT